MSEILKAVDSTSNVSTTGRKTQSLVWLVFGDINSFQETLSKLDIGSRDVIIIASYENYQDAEMSNTDLESPELTYSPYNTNTPGEPVDLFEPVGYGYYCLGDLYDELEEIGLLQPKHVRNKRSRADYNQQDDDNEELKDFAIRLQRKILLNMEKLKPPTRPIYYFGSDFKTTCLEINCNIYNQSSVCEIIQSCIDTHGHVDVLVNCSGEMNYLTLQNNL